MDTKCVFGKKYFCQLILLFSLFLLLFMGFTALFGTIHSHIILFQLTFIFVYSIFNKKNFTFNKIIGFQTYPKCT